MESSSLLSEGLNLMLFGMGFVFVFLTLLVIVTSLMSRIITRYEKNVGVLPEGGVYSPTAVIPGEGHPVVEAPPADDQTIISVLSAAVHKFRSRSK